MLTPEGLRIIVESGRSVESIIGKAKGNPNKEVNANLPETATIFQAEKLQADTSFIELLTQAELSL
jgi:hypothetical protein